MPTSGHTPWSVQHAAAPLLLALVVSLGPGQEGVPLGARYKVISSWQVGHTTSLCLLPGAGPGFSWCSVSPTWEAYPGKR